MPMGDTVTCVKLFRGCSILIPKQGFIVNLYHFDLTDFDVILGMDWLSKYHAQILLEGDDDLNRP